MAYPHCHGFSPRNNTDNIEEDTNKVMYVAKLAMWLFSSGEHRGIESRLL